MEVTRSFVRTFIFVFGNLVLVSYVYGLSHAPDKNALWGGIPWSQAKFIVPFMFLAAFGFLMYWWIILYQNEASAMESLRWPWGESDGGGGAHSISRFKFPEDGAGFLVVVTGFWFSGGD